MDERLEDCEQLMECLDEGVLAMKNRLTAFFYLLLRDKLPVGEVDLIIERCVRCNEESSPISFSDSLLASKADSLAVQLMEGGYLTMELDSVWGYRGEKKGGGEFKDRLWELVDKDMKWGVEAFVSDAKEDEDEE
jgi:hypothetical protein